MYINLPIDSRVKSLTCAVHGDVVGEKEQLHARAVPGEGLDLSAVTAREDLHTWRLGVAADGEPLEGAIVCQAPALGTRVDDERWQKVRLPDCIESKCLI